MEYCKICMRKVMAENSELCKSCNKKREVSKIILELSKNIDFKEELSKKSLMNIGITNKIRINHYIWSLEECNLIHKEKKHYIWEDEDTIINFIEKYDEDNIDEIKKNIDVKKANIPLCEKCGKKIKNPKKKTKYCDDCKKINKTLKNIKKIEKIVETGKTYTIEQLIEKTNIEEWKITGIIWDLQENDLVTVNDKEEYSFLQDKIIEYKENNETSPKIEKEKESTVETSIQNESKKTEETPEENIKITGESEKEKTTIKTTEKEPVIKTDEKISSDERETTEETLKENVVTNKEIDEDKTKEPISRIARHMKKISTEPTSESYDQTKEEKTTIKTTEEVRDHKEEKPAEEEHDLQTDKTINKIDINDDNLLDIIMKIDKYLQDYVEVLDRSVKNTDITSDEIFINFNAFLKDAYTMEIINKKEFSNLFTSELFKIYPRAYRSFTKNELNEEIIHYNIKTNYIIEEDIEEDSTKIKKESTTTENITTETEKTKFDEKTTEEVNTTDYRNIIKEYIENNLIILEREPLNNDITYHEIFQNYVSYCEEHNYNIDQNKFSKTFKELRDYYGIKRIFYLGKIRYNIEINKNKKPEKPKIEVKLRPIDKISEEEKEAHIQKTLNRIKNTEKTDETSIEEPPIETPGEKIPKEVPAKIFVATYDEKTIIFLKSRMKQENFEFLLYLMKQTSDKLHNTSISKLDDESYDVSLEFIVENDEKEETVKLIQECSWD